MSELSSMTGFASVQGSCPLGLITIELRCVNSRYLDLSLRINDDLRSYESLLRQSITQAISRGKLECRVSLQKLTSTEGKINEATLEHLKLLQDTVLQAIPSAQPMTITEILEYPGVTNHAEINTSELQQNIQSLINEALTQLKASRIREGTALCEVLAGHADTLEANVNALEPRIPQIHQQIKDKLTERLEAALNPALSQGTTLTAADISDRIRQEVTLYALKMDVTEEINRLRTHIQEMRRILKAGGVAGRKLDFLSQEMNREANTLGSKAASIEMTDTAIALKITIDQIREQVQNIE